jgi:hypothetical protein
MRHLSAPVKRTHFFRKNLRDWALRKRRNTHTMESAVQDIAMIDSAGIATLPGDSAQMPACPVISAKTAILI